MRNIRSEIYQSNFKRRKKNAIAPLFQDAATMKRRESPARANSRPARAGATSTAMCDAYTKDMGFMYRLCDEEFDVFCEKDPGK